MSLVSFVAPRVCSCVHPSFVLRETRGIIFVHRFPQRYDRLHVQWHLDDTEAFKGMRRVLVLEFYLLGAITLARLNPECST